MMPHTQISSSRRSTYATPRGLRQHWLPLGAIAASLVIAACRDDDHGDDDQVEQQPTANEEPAAEAPVERGKEGEGETQGELVSDGPVTATFPPDFPPPDRGEGETVVPGFGPLEVVAFFSRIGEGQRTTRIAGLAYAEFDSFAGRSPEEVLSDAAREMVADESRTFISDNAFERNGHPVHEVMYSDDSGYVRVRFHLVDSQYVQLQLVGKDQAEISGSDADAFFDSLEIDVDSEAS